MAVSKCLKTIVIVCNAMLCLIGGGCLAVGYTLQNVPRSMDTLFNPGEDGTLSIGMSYLRGGAIALAVAGHILTGMCGWVIFVTVKENRGGLIGYSVLVSLVLIAELAGGVLAVLYRQRLGANFKLYLNNTIVNNYYGMSYSYSKGLTVNRDDAYSTQWDFAHLRLECCGLDSYTDFNYATNWNRVVQVSANQNITAVLPLSCCKVVDSHAYPNRVDQLQFVNMSACLSAPTSATANINTGCYQALHDRVSTYVIALAVCAFVFFFLQLFSLVMVVILIRQIGTCKKVGDGCPSKCA